MTNFRIGSIQCWSNYSLPWFWQKQGWYFSNFMVKNVKYFFKNKKCFIVCVVRQVSLDDHRSGWVHPVLIHLPAASSFWWAVWWSIVSFYSKIFQLVFENLEIFNCAIRRKNFSWILLVGLGSSTAHWNTCYLEVPYSGTYLFQILMATIFDL